MLTLPIRTFRWSIENARTVGVAGAFVSVLYLKVSGNPPLDVFAVLAVMLPALEVLMFAAILAFYWDSVSDDADRPTGLRAFAIWFGLCFVAMWLNVALVRAGIDAYVRLGAPPAFDFAA